MSDHPQHTGPTLLDMLDEPVQVPTDWWALNARRALEVLASTGTEFTADDLRALGVSEPHHHSRWGGIFRTAAQDGLIVSTGARPSRRAARRGSLTHTWKGAL